MLRRPFIFYLLCLLCWPGAIFVNSQVQGYSSYAVWWFARQSGSTTLSRSVFSLNSWLLLAVVHGLILGLIPFYRLKVWLAASLGRFHYQPKFEGSSDLNLNRPLLWAWVLPAAVFLLRLCTWRPVQGHSVLSDSNLTVERFSYFFGRPPYYSLSFTNWHWFNDRLFITAPMLFLLAYPAGVWLRHHLPTYPSAATEQRRSTSADTLGS